MQKSVLPEYTQKEYDLLTKFIQPFILENAYGHSPVKAYEWASLLAFMSPEDFQDEDIEILRKAFKAIAFCTHYRHTPEFESLLDKKEI